MKNDSSKTSRPNSKRIFPVILGALFLGGFVAPSAPASPELDRQYALASIGILRAWDNVDGLFGDIVTKTYTDYLANQSRFVVQDLGRANDLMTGSKLSYAKVIEDPAILTQLSKTFKLDSFLRTRATKEGPTYRFTIEWVHAAKLQLLATEKLEIEQPFRGEGKLGTEEFRKALGDALERLIAKVPYKGTVTGRDQTAVTVNLGASSGLKKGDTLVFATLDDVKYHPLLKSIVDWRLTPTGRAKVDEVDEGLAFAKIETEEYGRQIARFQKIVQIIPGADETPVERRSIDLEKMDKRAKDPPRIGYVAPGLLLGSTSRDSTDGSGSSFLYGVKGEIQAWLTSDFFGELKLAYGAANYTQKDRLGATTLDGGSLSMSQFRLAAGYFYHVTNNFFGPKGWLKFGYQKTSYGLPQDATAKTGNLSTSGLFLGLGGDLPVRQDYGVLVDVDFGIFGSGTEDAGYYGTATGATSIAFSAGGYAWIDPKLRFQLGIDFKSNSVDFVNGGTISNKSIALAPSLQFFF